MSTSRRRGKAYKARPTINTLAIIAPPGPAQREQELARYRSSLLTLSSGSHPGEREWRELANCCNLVETMAMSTGQMSPLEVMPAVCDAVEGIRDAGLRFAAGKAMRLDGKALTAMAVVIDFYAQALEHLPAVEMAKVRAQCEHNIRRQVANPSGREVMAL